MPVKRRKSKARAGEAEAWAGYFQAGVDFFDSLAAVGLDEESAEPIAEETWHRIGREVIVYIERLYEGYPPQPRPFWAEEMFGAP